MLTWGLLGEGKGIEWAIDAMALLKDIRPRPRYLIAGRTHPKVAALEGERYRDMLIRRSWATGVAASVSFDDSYRDVSSLTRLIQQAAVVVLPYDSRDQVTSGVLVDAIAAGRPVVATAFPHAVELLSSGAGIVVPHENPAALAHALRRVSTEPDLAADMTAEAGRLAPQLGWPAVAGRYAHLADQVVAPVAAVSMTVAPAPSFAHISAMTDERGTFEHADHTEPRPRSRLLHRRHGSASRGCDARARRRTAPSASLARTAFRFLADAQGVDGKVRNRMTDRGRWLGRHGVEDCWGRTLWGFGTAAARSDEEWLWSSAVSYFERSAEQRSPWPRAMAFAALGAAELLAVEPSHRRARTLLADAAIVIGHAQPDTDWPWPEPRLTYANAVLPDALMAIGAALDRSRDGRRRVAPARVASRSPDERRSPFVCSSRRCRARRCHPALRSTTDRGRAHSRTHALGPSGSRMRPSGVSTSSASSAGSSATTTPRSVMFDPDDWRWL